MASGSYDRTVRLWDAATGAERGTLKGHSHDVTSVAFSPDGQLVASGSWDRTVRLWDAATGAERGTLEGHSDSVTSVAFSPDGQLVASCSYDKTVRLWDGATRAERKALELDVSIGKFDISSLIPEVLLRSSEPLRTLFVSHSWIMERGERILWLPPDYRATCVAVWNGIVVLGHSSGCISFLELG